MHGRPPFHGPVCQAQHLFLSSTAAVHSLWLLISILHRFFSLAASANPRAQKLAFCNRIKSSIRARENRNTWDTMRTTNFINLNEEGERWFSNHCECWAAAAAAAALMPYCCCCRCFFFFLFIDFCFCCFAALRQHLPNQTKLAINTIRIEYLLVSIS